MGEEEMKFLEFDLMTGATGQIVMIEGKPFVCVSKPNTTPITLNPMPYLVKVLGLERELSQALTHGEPKVRRCRP